MSGALLATLAAGNSGGGGTVVPDTLSWANIIGEEVGENAALTIAGITVPINIQGSLTGNGDLFYIHDGTYSASGAVFAVNDGDTLAWGVSNSGFSPVSGTVTVTNVSDSDTVLDTFTYRVTGGDE
jgi:hypothetical protein